MRPGAYQHSSEDAHTPFLGCSFQSPLSFLGAHREGSDMRKTWLESPSSRLQPGLASELGRRSGAARQGTEDFLVSALQMKLGSPHCKNK